MCGLCGLWGETSHWTSAASVPGARRGEAARLPARTRLLQQAAIERLVAGMAVSVRDWGGSSWIVTNANGASEIVSSMPEVWRAVETLSGRRLDPLAPATPVPGGRGCP